VTSPPQPGSDYVFLNPNSEVAKIYEKKPLTRLATLATLSPREKAENNRR
jgi:hypothetical protein